MPSTSSPTATMTEQSCKDDVAYVSNLLRSDFSFVPTTKEVDALQYCATKASQDIVQNTKTQRLSKLWSQDFASKVGLVPSTFSPQHTVLSKAGAAAVRSRQNEGFGVMCFRCDNHPLRQRLVHCYQGPDCSVLDFIRREWSPH
eukprot:m.419762 g.419762  ORF g.419762 m.419762 type:complete len:144 (-) comp21309_c0_seq2:1837-2268(-)